MNEILLENKVQLQENTIAELEVVRETDWGVFLDAESGNTTNDILLHKEQQIRPVKIGEKVQVFLYNDPKGRLTASMRLPRIKVGQVAYVPVINRTSFGAFVDLGTERGIFLPFSEMRGNVQEGDMVWIKLYLDKSSRLAVSMDVDEEMNLISKPAQEIKRGDRLIMAIYNITPDGALGITPERFIGFVHKSEWVGKVQVGQKIEIRVTFIREDGRINASMREQKEIAITQDANKILDYLKNNGGRMAYTDHTDASLLKLQFDMSKSAFKRALGMLMRKGLIMQNETTTWLTKES